MTTNTLPSSETGPLRFLSLAVGWNLAFFAVLRSHWFATHAAVPLAALQQAIAAWYGATAQVPVYVSAECSGTDVMALAAGVILAYPAGWARRVRGVAVTLAALFFLNIVRIGHLSMVAGSPTSFRLLHLYIWPTILIVAAAGLIFGWMRSAGATAPTLGRAARLSLFTLGAFAVAVPWLAPSRFVATACAFVPEAVARVMHAAGAQATAAGPLLTTPRGAFIVTSDCLLSPVIPLWVLAVLWLPLRRWQRWTGLALTLPVVTALAVLRLLVLAAPGAWVATPLVVVHGFHQLVIFAGLVTAVTFVAAQERQEPVGRAAGRALAILAVAAAGAMAVASAYNASIVLVARQAAGWAPHTLVDLLPPDDAQGALLLLPTFQAALLGALVWAARRRPRPSRLIAAATLLYASQAALLVVLGEASTHLGLHPHALVLRAWAVAWPTLLAFLVARGAPHAGDLRPRGEGYKGFWDRVGADFPDLGGARSTALYFENEKRLITRHLGPLEGRRVLKTDLWDEARNTRILQWVQAQGAAVSGVDISGPVLRLAREQFHGARVAVVGADVRGLPFADGSFDAVYSMGTVEHFGETAEAVREIGRVLRPGGRAIIGVPNRHDPFLRPALVALLSAVGRYDYGFEKSYSRRGLVRMVEASGLRVVADDGILFLPGWLRMLDLWCHTRCRPLARITGWGVGVFAAIDARFPQVQRHGYLVVAVGERPSDEEWRRVGHGL